MNLCVTFLLCSWTLQSNMAWCTQTSSCSNTVQLVLYTKGEVVLFCLRIRVVLTYKNHLLKILHKCLLWLSEANAKRYASHCLPPAPSRCSVNFLVPTFLKRVFCQPPVIGLFFFPFLQTMGLVSIHLHIHPLSKWIYIHYYQTPNLSPYMLCLHVQIDTCICSVNID